MKAAMDSVIACGLTLGLELAPRLESAFGLELAFGLGLGSLVAVTRCRLRT
jgi:hypothetical protein